MALTQSLLHVQFLKRHMPFYGVWSVLRPLLQLLLSTQCSGTEPFHHAMLSPEERHLPRLLERVFDLAARQQQDAAASMDLLNILAHWLQQMVTRYHQQAGEQLRGAFPDLRQRLLALVWQCEDFQQQQLQLAAVGGGSPNQGLAAAVLSQQQDTPFFIFDILSCVRDQVLTLAELEATGLPRLLPQVPLVESRRWCHVLWLKEVAM